LRTSNSGTERTTGWRYDGHVVTQTDPLGHIATEARSAWGSILRVADAAGGSTHYDYDAFGRLLQVRDALNNTLGTISYNARGMKLAQTDMDLGSWTYTPNALGEVIALRDGKSQVLNFTYDKLGRPTSRSAPEGTSSWTWGGSATKHNIGRLASMAGPGYSESLAYDSYGRPAARTITSDAIYRYDYAYNSVGLLDSLTYPATGSGSRFKLAYEYDSGELVRIRDASATATSFWRLNAQDAAGNILDETLGASIRVISGFNPVSGVMDYRQAGAGGGSAIQDLAYAWDANDNLVSRRDLKQGLTEEFRYDALDRLDDARRNGVIKLDLSYNSIGNILWKSDVCPTSAPCFDYHQGKKHAVIAAGGQTYGYDANGNMTNRGGASISWTSDNLPNTITQANGNSSQFWHGPAGRRWKQTAIQAGATETTIYAGELMEKVTRAGITTWRHYVLAPSGTAAIHLRYNNGAPAATRYLTHDHQGSTDKLLDASGNVLVAESFAAFGARRGPGWSGMPGAPELALIAATTRDGYTGHEHLDNLDLIHMNGRVYDPRIGRFISADPYIPEPYSGQGLNRFAYVMNNPLSLIDPSGFDPETPCMEAPNGRCARVTVIGARWADFIRYFGGAGVGSQVESASQRDPCGQDSNALTCTMQSVQPTSPARIVLTAGTKVDSTLSQNSAIEFLQGAAARLGNIAFNAAPVTWLFDSNMDFHWFPEPDSIAGRQGAMLGNVGLLIGGVAKSTRTAINHVPAELARVIRGRRTLTTLGKEGVEDVFVVAADDIAGLNASQLAQRLTISASDVFTVVRFSTPASGIASPVFRSSVGFLEGGFTRGGAREFVIPNGPIPYGARIEVIGP
ncbi:MAG: polymorphic toxin type 10 domain-containing protein, partial [Steroidobacteraceae bacterium]